MKIVDIREKTVSLRSDIADAVIDFGEMTCSIVAVVSNIVRDGRPLVGYGFGSSGRYGQGAPIRERFVPRLKASDPDDLLDATGRNFDPARMWDVMMRNEKPGGHGERSVAVGTLDMALWDLVAKIEGVPLWRLLADRFNGGRADTRVWVYAAGGYYHPGKDVPALQEEMRGYLRAGYTTVKMKIGGASMDEDRRRIEAVLAVVGDGAALAVDADGRFDRDTAFAYADMLAPYGLRWFEEPGDPLDHVLQADLAACYGGPLATGENLFSVQDARNLVRHGGMRPDRDLLQFDPALAYGVVEYLRILDMLKEEGWSPRRCIPHGGHQMALDLAAGLGLGGTESHPGVFQPFGGFADDIAVENGHVALPDSPGIGFERKAALWAVLRTLTDYRYAMRRPSFGL